MPVRIVIADDHGVLRGGLRTLLNLEPDMRVVGEAADGQGALRLAQELRPDILLADISMPEPSGIEVARHLRSSEPSVRVLILTMHEDPNLVCEAMDAGACGYVPKRLAESELITAIRAVTQGGSYFVNECSRQRRGLPVERQPLAKHISMDAEERALLRLVADGHCRAQIADMLALSPETVEARYQQLMRRLGVNGRAAVVRFAIDNGLR